jgi:hypothetical protein
MLLSFHFILCHTKAVTVAVSGMARSEIRLNGVDGRGKMEDMVTLEFCFFFLI